MSKKQKKSGGSGLTPLSALKRKGTKLVGPLSSLNMNVMDWEKDYLPEFLWIAALAQEFGIDHFHDPYNVFLDALDKTWSDETPLLGLISDFNLIPQDRRSQFLSDNAVLVERLFYKPIGRIIAFYPDCPAFWLFQKASVDKNGPLDPGTELGYLRSLILQLLPGKSDFPARVRAVPLNRLFKHNKLFFTKDLEVINAIPKYPHQCSPKEKFMVESMARSTLNIVIQHRKDLLEFKWSKYFWRHNYDLVICKEHESEIRGSYQVNVDQEKAIIEILSHNARVAREYLIRLRSHYRPDLYDPSKDEVLFGIFSRLTRLLSLIMDDQNLWARDTGGIMLRCLADSAITFCYLITANRDDDFMRFIQYGEGQQKLLMLHLQDNYPGETSLEGMSAQDLSEHFGKFMPELIDIELGNWLKKDMRKVAADAGMEQLYRLVYNPASGDIHGNWHALKGAHLTHCSEPLHRFHRLPSLTPPLFFISIVEAATGLYEHCLKIATEYLNYPLPIEKLRSIKNILANL